MGVKAADALDVSFDELPTYLLAKHSIYMDVDGSSYYLTDVNDSYWRVQDTSKMNEKGHYVDCSELVPTVGEFIHLPFAGSDQTIAGVFDKATFYASEKPEA